MKTARKFLCVALVLVMALGMVHFATAADFTDKKDIQYTEAADVLTYLETIDGYPDGSFGPKKDVTRAEAATMIARMMLGRKTADRLPIAVTFPDVAATHWAAPYIAFCAGEGIIAGRSDGKFYPNDNVTAAELAIMLLRALKLAEPGRYSGGTWQMFAILDGMKYGILTTDVDYTKAATREEAAQYIFNAFKYCEKEVSKTEQFFQIVMIPGAGSFANPGILTVQYKTYAEAQAAAAGDSAGLTIGKDYTISVLNFTVLDKSGSIAQTVHKLKESIGPDDFMRPGVRTWKNEKGQVVTSAKTEAPVITYTAPVRTSTLFADLKLSKNTTAVVYWDGILESAAEPINYTITSNFSRTGNGMLTEVYVDKDGNYTVIIITTFVGQVTEVKAATAVAKETVVVTGYSSAPPIPFSPDVEYAATGYKAKDVVIYTATFNGTDWKVQSMQVAEKAELTATSWAVSSFTAGGKTYRYNLNCPGFVGNFNTQDVYFDIYGYVIYTSSPAVPDNYAYVANAKANVSTGTWTDGQSRALLVTADGELLDVEITATVSSLVAGYVGNIVTYKTVSGGKYELTLATTQFSPNGSISLTKGVSKFDWAGGVYYGNSKTLYIVRTGTDPNYKYAAYTGFANVPGMSGNVQGRVVYGAGMVASVVYVESPGAAVTTDLIFVAKKPAAQDMVTLPGGVVYYPAEILVNGQMKAVFLDTDYNVGYYQTIATDDKDITKLGGGNQTAVTANINYANGVISIGGTINASFAPAEAINVYVYDAVTGDVTTGSLNSIPGAATSRTFFVVYSVNGNEITNLFLMKP